MTIYVTPVSFYESPDKFILAYEMLKAQKTLPEVGYFGFIIEPYAIDLVVWYYWVKTGLLKIKTSKDSAILDLIDSAITNKENLIRSKGRRAGTPKVNYFEYNVNNLPFKVDRYSSGIIIVALKEKTPKWLIDYHLKFSKALGTPATIKIINGKISFLNKYEIKVNSSSIIKSYKWLLSHFDYESRVDLYGLAI